MTATRDCWKTTPLSHARAEITLDRSYTLAEFDRIMQGFVPQEMEHKWFIYYEDPWLYLHRSWTGFCIYQVRFERAGETWRVAEVLVTRDADQYGGDDDMSDGLLLAVLLDGQAGRDSGAAWDAYMSAARKGSDLA